jgi:hypothetical protein
MTIIGVDVPDSPPRQIKYSIFLRRLSDLGHGKIHIRKLPTVANLSLPARLIRAAHLSVKVSSRTCYPLAGGKWRYAILRTSSSEGFSPSGVVQVARETEPSGPNRRSARIFGTVVTVGGNIYIARRLPSVASALPSAIPAPDQRSTKPSFSTTTPNLATSGSAAAPAPMKGATSAFNPQQARSPVMPAAGGACDPDRVPSADAPRTPADYRPGPDSASVVTWELNEDGITTNYRVCIAGPYRFVSKTLDEKTASFSIKGVGQGPGKYLVWVQALDHGFDEVSASTAPIEIVIK